MLNIFVVPRSCSEYKAIGVETSGYYLIDPKQQKGISTKFNVFCDFDNGNCFSSRYVQDGMLNNYH